VSRRPPSTAGSCRSSSRRRRGDPPLLEDFNPSRGSLSGGRVDAEEDPQEDFLALGALLEDEREQSTDYKVRQGHDHDLAGGAIGVVAPRGAERPAGEGSTRSTCARSTTLETHGHPQAGAKGAIGPLEVATAGTPGAPDPGGPRRRGRVGRIRTRSPHPFRRRKPLFCRLLGAESRPRAPASAADCNDSRLLN
jgi:hypothetical protein